MSSKNLASLALEGYILIALFIALIGLVLPVIGGAISYNADEKWKQAYNEDNDQGMADARLETALGSTIDGMAAPLIFFSIAVLVAGLLRSKIIIRNIACPKCGKTMISKFNYCYNCGHDLKKGTSHECPKCSKIVYANQEFCSHCGLEMEWTKNGEEE